MPQRDRPRMPLVYVAGPLSGVMNVEGGFPVQQRWDNVHNAMRVALQLQDMGCACHVPHSYAIIRDEMVGEHTGSDEKGRQSWDKELRMDEETILRCDALFRIPGQSAGTDREVAFASRNAVPVLHSLEEAKQFIDAFVAGLPAPVSSEAQADLDRIAFCTSFAKLADEIGRNAEEKGFWTAHRDRARKALQDSGIFHMTVVPRDERGDLQPVNTDNADLIEQALDVLEKADIVGDPAVYLALIAGEAHEGINALRQDPANWGGKDGVNEEGADTYIRLVDFVVRYAKKSGLTPYGFAERVYEKMAFNKTRPFRHSKRF